MAPRSDNKKLKLMAAESDEDRISALPDREIHRVLSFLPAHEAVQTCLLARRWRGIWKSMPVLRVFDPWSWGGWAAAEFNKFVNHLLFFRDQTPLEEFDFTTYPYQPQMTSDAFTDSVEPARYLQMWIRYALTREVRVFRVHVISSRDPEHLLFNGPLISQHLVTLELFCVVLDGCSMDFSCCPLLEDLKICTCRISAQKMLSQSIRRLCIIGCKFSDKATRLQIFVPNLSALRLGDNDGLTPFLGSMPLLATAFVRLHHDSSRDCFRHTNLGDYCGRDLCIGCYGSEKCVVLGGLSNATSLQLQTSESWSTEELTYKRKMDESCSLVEQFIPTEHLKRVEVSCCKVVKNVDKLVETLIACGMPPNIISIKRSDS